MKCNVGTIDSVLRMLVGVGLIVWAVLSGNIIGYIGVILVVTGIFRFCPFYTLLKIKTGCKKEQ